MLEQTSIDILSNHATDFRLESSQNFKSSTLYLLAPPLVCPFINGTRRLDLLSGRLSTQGSLMDLPTICRFNTPLSRRTIGSDTTCLEIFIHGLYHSFT
ncbi:hypothetical protein Lal_00013635 [Lupinus albus]|nr:hypothetical protein Lal_00013635 [Lupinus albus]